MDIRLLLRRGMRARRKVLSLSMAKAAKRVGMHPQQWQRVEAGKRYSTLTTIARVSCALRLDIYDLLSEPPARRSGPGKPPG